MTNLSGKYRSFKRDFENLTGGLALWGFCPPHFRSAYPSISIPYLFTYHYCLDNNALILRFFYCILSIHYLFSKGLTHAGRQPRQSRPVTLIPGHGSIFRTGNSATLPPQSTDGFSLACTTRRQDNHYWERTGTALHENP